MFNACQRFRFSDRVKETEIRCTHNDSSVLIPTVLLGCLGDHNYIEDWNKVDIWLKSNTIVYVPSGCFGDETILGGKD